MRTILLTLASVTWLASSAFAQPMATAPDTTRMDVKDELESLKAENAAVRELLVRMQDQQKALLEQVDRLERRLDGVTTAAAQTPMPPAIPTTPPAQKAEKTDHYQDGIVIWENPEDAKVPFLLKFNNNTQL